MKPDATKHNPDPQYIRWLIDSAGLSQRRAAHVIGISERAMRYHCQPADHPTFRAASYPVQYTLEALAGKTN
jgi:hypothetical protein